MGSVAFARVMAESRRGGLWEIAILYVYIICRTIYHTFEVLGYDDVIWLMYEWLFDA